MPQGPMGESVLWVKHCFQSLLARVSYSVAFLPDKWEVEEGAIFIQAGSQAGSSVTMYPLPTLCQARGRH